MNSVGYEGTRSGFRLSGALFETQVDPNPKALSTQFSAFPPLLSNLELSLEYLRDSPLLFAENRATFFFFNFSTKIGLRWRVKDGMEKCGRDLRDLTLHGRKFEEGGGRGREEEFWLGENITMTSVHE